MILLNMVHMATLTVPKLLG